MLIRHFLQEPDMMIDGYFTPESANSTLPKIIDKLKMLAEIRGRLESEERELNEAVSLNEFTRRKRRLNRTLADMYSLIEEIENYDREIRGRLESEERELNEAVSLNEFTRRKRRLNRTLADMYSLIEEIENYGC